MSLATCLRMWGFRRNFLRHALALFVLLAGATTVMGVSDEERVLSFYNIHTKETIRVVYKRNGKYVPESMKKIDHIMRDWRRNEPTKMDRKLIDLIWSLHAQLGSQKPIHVISGYRSRKTNEKLRRRGGGQARNSRHILGKAADIHFPDVSAKQLRNSALVRERGGVGYYPTSAIPFVHVDTGRVRHWPRIPRLELAALFPDGKTKHRPRGGRAISKRDYKRAMARLSAKQKRLIRIARGEIKPDQPETATYQVASVPSPRPASTPNPASNPAPSTASSPASKPNPAPLVTASIAPRAENPLPPEPSEQIVEQDQSRLIFASADPLGDFMTRKLFGNASPRAAKPALSLGKISDPAPAAAPQPDGWARAPSFDPDHDDALAYQPFPILPLMGDLAQGGDAQFGKLTPPAHNKILAFMGEKDAMPMQFQQGLPFAQALWANEFKGLAVASLALGKGSSHPKTREYLAQNRKYLAASR